MRRMEFFLFWEDNISLNLYIKLVFSIISSVANIYLLILICNKNLRISSLKMSFHIERGCQIVISIHNYLILIEHIHCLEGIHRIY